jgi:hypothetical protein
MDTIQTTPVEIHPHHKPMKALIIGILLVAAFLLGMWVNSTQANVFKNQVALFSQTLNEMNPQLGAEVSRAVSARMTSESSAVPGLNPSPKPVPYLIWIEYHAGGKCSAYEAILQPDGTYTQGALLWTGLANGLDVLCAPYARIDTSDIGIIGDDYHPAFTKDITSAFKDVNEVRLLQFLLARESVYNVSTFTAVYDAATQAAVKLYQKKYSLRETGIVDAATRAKLNQSKWMVRDTEVK